MPTTPVVLVLPQEQIDALNELGIDHTKLYFVDNDQLNSQTPSVNAFSSGHHLVFFEGTEIQHRLFLSHLYGFPGNYYELTGKFRGVFVYGSPTAKFVNSSNLATITVSD